MCDNIIKHHKSWDNFIDNSKEIDKAIKILNSLENFCPLKENVFRFLSTDLDNAKCIILGMDPYPSTFIFENKKIPVATGRAFEINNAEYFTDNYKQSSLSTILKTLWYYKYDEILSKNDIKTKILEKKLPNIKIKNWFDDMEKQGVLFLNAALTVKEGSSGSHEHLWASFMNELISYLSLNKKIKWLIWGKDALNRVEPYVSKANIIYSCHPSSRVHNNFIEECCFKKVNNVKWF